MLLPKKIVDSLNKEIKTQEAIVKNLKENESNYSVNHQATISEIQKSIDYMKAVINKAQ